MRKRNRSGNTRMYRLRIKELAEARNITRTKLSRLAELQYDTVNGIWHNEQRDISLSTMLKIARVLGVKVEELYEQAGSE